MLPFFAKGQAKEWLYQNFIALDQSMNTLFNGSADETFSSRCYRMNDRNPYSWMEKVVDAMFYLFQGPGHCKNAYAKELAGRHRAGEKKP